jgi:hypothetical protein
MIRQLSALAGLPLCTALLFSALLPAFVPAAAHALEKLDYSVVETFDDVEIRDYPAHILATVEVSADFEQAGNRAFRDLFRFITGANESRQDIAMTAPVLQAPADQGFAISFVMPSEFDATNIPRPTNSRVRLDARSPAKMAAVMYSGGWNEKRYAEHEQVLLSRMDELGYKACGQPIWARHNSPMMPAWFRKNEVLVPICSDD